MWVRECARGFGACSLTQTLQSHTGLRVAATDYLLDEQGRVYLVTDLGLGLVHTLDVSEYIAAAVGVGGDDGFRVQASDLPLRYGFVRSPFATSCEIGKVLRAEDAS